MNDVRSRPGRRWSLAGVAAFVLILLIAYPSLRRLGEVLRDHKPGVWGMPSWYIALLVAYGVLTGAVMVQALAFALRRAFSWRQWTLLLLGLTAVRGLLYGSLAPPWQAPDEHAHFEYAALMARLKRVPTLEDISPELQRQIAQSMFDYDMWRYIGREPVPAAPEGFLRQIGIPREPPTHTVDNRYLYFPQVGTDPPLYYVAPALVYALRNGQGTTQQLYTMRLPSVLMLVGLLGSVVWANRGAFGDDPALLVGVSAVVGWLPMLGHIGSVLSNEVLASVFTTLALGLLMLTLRAGLTWWRGLALVALMTLALVTRQSTLWLVVLIGGVGAVRLAQRQPWARVALPVLVCLAVVALLAAAIAPSGQARYWRQASRWGATAICGEQPAEGNCALRVASASGEGVLTQALPAQATLDARGQTIEVSAAVRAVGHTGAGALMVTDLDSGDLGRVDFTAASEWQTFTLRFSVPESALHLQLGLIAVSGSQLLFDQVTIHPTAEALSGVPWLRNPSGEEQSSVAEAALVALGRRLGQGGAVQQLFTLSPASLWRLVVDRRWAELSFGSFWGNFGAALAVPLASAIYTLLKGACGLALVGLGVCVYRLRKGWGAATIRWQAGVLAVLAASYGLAWVLALIPGLGLGGRWTLQGRYLFPVIWPIAALLATGWLHLVPSRGRGWAALTVLSGMVALDAAGLVRMAHYFHGL